jgi:hypothetical protein
VSGNVVLVHLDRPGSTGGRRRLDSWRAIFESAGAHVSAVAVPAELRRRPDPRAVVDLVAGRAVPERLAWATTTTMRNIAAHRPQLVVAITARVFDRRYTELAASTILDYVDQISVSYRQRAALASNPARAVAYRALSAGMRRFETHRPAGVQRVAAGWTDARHLDAEWVPIVSDRVAAAAAPPGRSDVIFIGKLSYPPNVDAVQRLARIWPGVVGRRPGSTAVLAGAAPDPGVLALVQQNGWRLVPDFGALSDLVGEGTVAVAPLTHTTGFQIKVIDAAALGLAQVVSPEAVRGLAPGFPAAVAASDHEFAELIVQLLDSEDSRSEQARSAIEVLRAEYTAEAWGAWAARALSGAGGRAV